MVAARSSSSGFAPACVWMQHVAPSAAPTRTRLSASKGKSRGTTRWRLPSSDRDRYTLKSLNGRPTAGAGGAGSGGCVVAATVADTGAVGGAAGALRASDLGAQAQSDSNTEARRTAGA